MGKISPVSAKYIVHSQIFIDGVVERPDVIGAIFGQTEGLLGNDLELRELQRSGRIGRIEVNVDIKSGKSNGEIIIPSSLDKAETAIIAAALETIQRIGPCNAKVRSMSIEDVRISKRRYVIERAKELLRDLTGKVLPDSSEITEEVAHSVRMMEITEYGNDRLPAGPSIEDSDEIIVVEGRADVLNLLKHGIKNAVALNGTNIPPTILELCKRKVVTVFVDGDRGGDLIIKALSDVAEIDYVIKAPDGKEVEEITKKEIHQALRNKVAVEQVKSEIKEDVKSDEKNFIKRDDRRDFRKYSKTKVGNKDSDIFRDMLNDLIGTRGAYILDQNSNILGKVPISEISSTIRSLNGIYAIIFDGTINKDLVVVAERAGVKYVVGMKSLVNSNDSKVGILTSGDFWFLQKIYKLLI